MAWKAITHCQQCKHKLSARDRALGTICTACVKGPRKLFDNAPDEGESDEHND